MIETKLLLPRLRQRLVARGRLEALLKRGAETTLTLISAPAGFGKTTLLGNWFGHHAAENPVAWVSLDERDADASTFWAYVLRAVDRAVPGTATAALAELGSGQAPVEDALSVLVNELGVTPHDITVVLDDYHLADSPDIGPAMSFLLEHLPPQVHLVISTRADPALPLARLRARGQLVEVRAADLRFTSDEATAYLNEVNTLALDAGEIAALESRTEGWAAALQLAALSLQGRDDPAEFISGFAGDDRFVVDYLADEVLDRQPSEVRTFLLETSVLDELTAPLCDAVAERADSKAMLQTLERENLFLVPLDDQRRRYRYHHLFADVLRTRLLDERPGDAPMLHRRASDWYHQAGEPEAAVRHALAAGDLVLAADRIELAIPALMQDRREAVLHRWAHELPADAVKNRPVLAVGFIGGLMTSNDFDGVEQRLQYVETLLNMPADDLVIANRREFSRLPAAVQTYRAALALVSGDPPRTVQHAEIALALAAEDDHLSIASASALLGLASWTGGDLAAAHRAYRAATEHLERAGHIADVLGCSITLADLEVTQGRLREARRTFEHALALASGAPMRGVADMYVGLSRVSWERGDLAAVAEYLRKADEVGDPAGLPQNPYRWRVMMALLRHAQGDTATAIELLDEAGRVYLGDFAPNVRPVAATRARLLAASGNLVEATAWARERGIAAGDEPTYLGEYDHLTLTRVLLAEHAATANQSALADAITLLNGILPAAQEGGRTGIVIETLVLQALAERAAGNMDSAMDALAPALQLAEPEGFVRVFTDEGPAMRELLENLVRHSQGSTFVQHLLHAFVGSTAETEASTGRRAMTEATTMDTAGRDMNSGARPRQVLVGPLSSRELDVLRLLGSDLGGPDIARQLHVSLSTVRTHTQRIYAKLGVTNRRAAVRRAHQLDLFPRAAR